VLGLTFQWPLALLGLLLVPLAIGAYVLWDRRRGRTVARFSTPSLFPNMVAKAPGRVRHVPVIALLLALTAVLVGVARPHATVSEPREEATVVLAMDVSRSMTAVDVRPTRLGAARGAALRFLEKVPRSFRVGVVAFADKANVVAPPTDDRGVVEQALAQTESGEGTALGEAIQLSLKAAQQVPGAKQSDPPPPASVLLISDGAQTQGRVTPIQAARRARQLGVPVYTISLGTADGVVERKLPGGYTERVRVPPDPTALRQVAVTSGGEFFTALDDKRLQSVYEELGSRLGSREKDAEVTVAFAGAGMGLLLLAGMLSSLLFRRLP
jgi:Ca-activated chloride channel family protein